MIRPVLGEIELQQVQRIETDADQVWTQHSIPALEGDFFQGLGRKATWVKLSGVLSGAEVQTGLDDLRQKFYAAEPVAFAADIATATQLDQVLIEEMGVRELAGKPSRFEYAFTLREFTPPPILETETSPTLQVINEEVAQEGTQQVSETVEDINENVGELRVEVLLANGSQNFSNLVVFVEGTTEADETVYFTIETQIDGVYTRQNVPVGEYTVSVVRQ